MNRTLQSIRLKKKSEIEFPCSNKKIYIFEITKTYIYNDNRILKKRVIKDTIQSFTDLSLEDNKEQFRKLKKHYESIIEGGR